MSNLFSCPFPSLQMLQPLGSQSPLCLFSNSLSSHRDKLFPAFGFGAQVPPDWQVSTVFALIFNPSNPCCTGIQGIVDAYRQALPQVRLYVPTNSARIINHVAMLAPQAAHQGSGSQHLVLLLPTDGAVTGVEAAREAVVCASHLRKSVILAGVGGADLEAVEQLGADSGAWVHTPCRRAVCAPRPLPEGPSGDAGTEVPTQLVSYFKAHSHRFYPQPRARQRLLQPRFP